MQLPVEIVNNILSFRPAHPDAVLIKNYYNKLNIICKKVMKHFVDTVNDAPLTKEQFINDTKTDKYIEGGINSYLICKQIAQLADCDLSEYCLTRRQYNLIKLHRKRSFYKGIKCRIRDLPYNPDFEYLNEPYIGYY